MRVVVDASVVLAWFLPELPEPKALANALLTCLRELDGGMLQAARAAKVKVWQL